MGEIDYTAQPVYVEDGPVLDVARVVELEKQIDAAGTSLAELMDRAGAAVAGHIRDMFERAAQGAFERTYEPAPRENPLAPKPAVAFLCGSGNNGGDGWVAAELLAREGVPVVVVTAKLPEEITAQPAHDAAVRSMDALMELGGTVLEGDEPLPLADDEPLGPEPLILLKPSRLRLNLALRRVWVIADAVLGTGFNAKAMREPYHGWVVAANNTWSAAKLAVDVPSGVSAQAGYPAGCIHARFLADETITMIARKPGLAARECGQVYVAALADIAPFLEG